VEAAEALRRQLSPAALDALERVLSEAGFEAHALARELLPALSMLCGESAQRFELSLRRYEHEAALALLREMRQQLGC
jgi:hypothetical protein